MTAHEPGIEPPKDSARHDRSWRPVWRRRVGPKAVTGSVLVIVAVAAAIYVVTLAARHPSPGHAAIASPSTQAGRRTPASPAPASDATPASHPGTFTRYAAFDGTTIWLRRTGTTLDLRATGAVSEQCAAPVGGSADAFSANVCLLATSPSGGRVFAYTGSRTSGIRGLAMAFSDGTIVRQSIVIDIDRLFRGRVLIVAVVPGEHAVPISTRFVGG